MAAEVVTALRHAVSRYAEPLSALVVKIGTIRGNFARNIIAPSVTVRGIGLDRAGHRGG